MDKRIPVCVVCYDDLVLSGDYELCFVCPKCRRVYDQKNCAWRQLSIGAGGAGGAKGVSGTMIVNISTQKAPEQPSNKKKEVDWFKINRMCR